MSHNCTECKHLIIVEDRSQDIRPPIASCSKKVEIIETDICEWTPSKNCQTFEQGEPEWI